MLDDLLLPGPEGVVTEDALQHLQRRGRALGCRHRPILRSRADTGTHVTFSLCHVGYYSDVSGRKWVLGDALRLHHGGRIVPGRDRRRADRHGRWGADDADARDV